MYLKTPTRWTRSANTRRFVKSAAILLALLFCTPLFAQTPVTMQLRWKHQFQFAGYYAALHKGFYKDAGLDVTLKEGGPSFAPINDVLAGRADFGVTTSGLVKAYLDGAPILMLAPIVQHSPNVLLSLGTKLTNPADIARAGPISIPSGDEGTDLKAIFINEGISPGKLKITSGANLDDLVHGKIVAINAYVSNEPFWLKQHGIAYSVIKPESYGMDFYSDVLFTTQSMEKAHPETVVAFRAATLKGWEYALSHQDEIIDLILAHYNTQEKNREQFDFEAQTLKDLIAPDLVRIGYSNPDRWRQIAKTFERFELIKSDKSLDGFFYQTDKKQDLTKFYYGLGIALVTIAIVSGISFYIYWINRRLRRAAIEQAEVEDLLRKNKQRYQIFFEASPSIGLVWTDGFIVTDWNHQAEEVFGFKRDEVLGRSYFDFLIPDAEKSVLHTNLAGMTQSNTLHNGTNTNLTRDGQVLTIEWFNASLPTMPDRPQEILSLGLDITERCKSEKKLAQVMANLEQAEADQRILVSVASHEFRTPAAMIKTSLDSLDILKDQISPAVAIRLENIAKASSLSDFAKDDENWGILSELTTMNASESP